MAGGVVYLATETGRAAASPGRTVVVRLYDAPWVEGAESLLRAAHLAMKSDAVTHPNHARLIDLGTDAGQAYCVTDWIDDGMLLSEYVELERGLALETFVPIAGQILNAVGHAHARSKFFGDLDGSSIIVGLRNGRNNHVMLTAFGLTADLAAESPRATPYSAPESVNPAEMFDLRRDVYSVGVLLWHMLTAQFLPTDPERSLADSWEGEALPSGLTELIEDCVARDPAKRPADVNVVLRRMCEVIPAEMFRLPHAERQAPKSVPNAPAGTAIDLPNIDRLREFARSEPLAFAPGDREPVVARKRSRRWWPIGFGLATVGCALAIAWAPWGLAEATPRQTEVDARGSASVSQAASVEAPTPDTEPVALTETPRVAPVEPIAQPTEATRAPDATAPASTEKVAARAKPRRRRRAPRPTPKPTPELAQDSPAVPAADRQPDAEVGPDALNVTKLDDELRDPTLP